MRLDVKPIVIVTDRSGSEMESSDSDILDTDETSTFIPQRARSMSLPGNQSTVTVEIPPEASQSLTLDIKPILKSRSFEVPTPPKTSPCKCRRRMTITGLEEARLMKFKAAALKAHFADSYIDNNGLTLIYSRHEKIPFKDFRNEVRAIKDVQNFIDQTALLLFLEETNLDKIIAAILKRMLGHLNNYEQCMIQAMEQLFTNDNVHQLNRTLQCATIDFSGGGFVHGQNFVCALCNMNVQNRFVGIGRLNHPTNLGPTCQEVSFVVVVLAPFKSKGIRTEVEIGRTFATMLTNSDFRQALLDARNEMEFVAELKHQMSILSQYQRIIDNTVPTFDVDYGQKKARCRPFIGLIEDFKRRIVYYKSDYLDGISDRKTIEKVISTTFFLYFACLLPSIAFGVLNSFNTNNILTVEKVLCTQTFGGLIFALFGGTPQVVLLTTAPLALFTKIIFNICEQYDLQFKSMFCCVGLWNAFFLVLYAIFNISDFMQFSTRSTEEIFSLFIATAFAYGAIKNTVANFDKNYFSPACKLGIYSAQSSSLLSTPALNITEPTSYAPLVLGRCQRDVSLLYILLMLGTLVLGVTLFKFTKTPYLNVGKRELFSDYSLPVAVITVSFIGTCFFGDIKMGDSFDSRRDPNLLQLVTMEDLPVGAVFAAMGLGLCLSLLFYMGQNICAKFVNDPNNRMKKGTADHWDLIIIAVVNACLSLYTFPWLHAALPHSPMHVFALSDMEERVEQGIIERKVVRVRETRLTGIFSHILIGLSLLILPILCKIQTPVLYGVFLYLAATALLKNQIVERVALFFMQPGAYPPNHYIRRVPEGKMHAFTLAQILQYGLLCVIGFFAHSYIKMLFPVFIFLLIPIRHKVLTRLFNRKYLKAIDGH